MQTWVKTQAHCGLAPKPGRGLEMPPSEGDSSPPSSSGCCPCQAPAPAAWKVGFAEWGGGVGVWCCFVPFLIQSSSPPIHTRAVCPSSKYLPACLQEIARHHSGNMCASFIKWIIDCLLLSPRFPLGVWVRNQADSYLLVHTSLSTPGCCRCLLLCEQSSV